MVIFLSGEKGDYFYIIEKGIFTVIINKAHKGQIGPGKSFGELALLYDIERQATIRAESSATVFALDRATFKFTLANNMEDKSSEIKEAVQKVPLLQGLTSQQMDRLTDTVMLIDYNPGEESSSNTFLSLTFSQCQVTV